VLKLTERIRPQVRLLEAHLLDPAGLLAGAPAPRPIG
jgi:hypothetical protein